MNIVFDFGAVMVDWRPAKVVAKHFPAQAHDDTSATALGQRIFTHAAWKAFDQGLLAPEQVINQLLITLDLPRNQLSVMVHSIADHLQPIDSSVQLLAKLNAERQRYGIDQLFFLSNMPEPYSRALEEAHDWVHWFDGGIFSGDVKLVKPEAPIYALVEERLQAKGSKILFIDDHAANISAAQQRGWHTLHLTQPSKLPEQLMAMLPKIMR